MTKRRMHLKRKSLEILHGSRTVIAQRSAERRLYLQRGVTAIEYALIASMICIVIAVSVGTVGVKVRELYDGSAERIVGAIKEALARL